jgi:hypothetical protein
MAVGISSFLNEYEWGKVQNHQISPHPLQMDVKIYTNGSFRPTAKNKQQQSPWWETVVKSAWQTNKRHWSLFLVYSLFFVVHDDSSLFFFCFLFASSQPLTWFQLLWPSIYSPTEKSVRLVVANVEHYPSEKRNGNEWRQPALKHWAATDEGCEW